MMVTKESFCVKPKILIIEFSGLEKLVNDIESIIYVDLDKAELVSKILYSILRLDTSLTNLEHLVNKLSKKINNNNNNKELLKNKLTDLSLIVFNNLLTLGCYENNKVNYCFGGFLFSDTVILWKPNKDDVLLT